MATKRISELPAVAAIVGDELLEVTSAGPTSKKLDIGLLYDSIAPDTLAFIDRTGATDVGPAIQAIINASGADVTLYFPPGEYLIDTQVTIITKARIKIYGDNAHIKIGPTLMGDNGLIRIQDVQSIDIRGLEFHYELNSNICGAINMIYCTGCVRIDSCRFLEFQNLSQYGIRARSINNINGSPTSNDNAGAIYSNLQFSVADPLNSDLDFDYANAWQRGYGINVQDNAEYFTIIGCHFFGLTCGVWLTNAPNGMILGCEFQQMNGYSGLATKRAGIYEDSAVAANNGKLSITGCKFNHGWYYSILDSSPDGDRPYSISNCQFIANSFDQIGFSYAGTKSGLHSITNCFFQRCYNYLGLASWPHGVAARQFIVANRCTRVSVQGNIFDDNTAGAIIVTLNTSDYWFVINNLYRNIFAGPFTLVGANNQVVTNYLM